jgi:hypothetical protein
MSKGAEEKQGCVPCLGRASVALDLAGSALIRMGAYEARKHGPAGITGGVLFAGRREGFSELVNLVLHGGCGQEDAWAGEERAGESRGHTLRGLMWEH